MMEAPATAGPAAFSHQGNWRDIVLFLCVVLFSIVWWDTSTTTARHGCPRSSSDCGGGRHRRLRPARIPSGLDPAKAPASDRRHVGLDDRDCIWPHDLHGLRLARVVLVGHGDVVAGRLDHTAATSASGPSI